MTVSKRAPSPVAARDSKAAATTTDQDAMDVKALAKGVLARDFRPRANSVRRLAEAVLAKDAPAAKPKKKKKKGSGKKAGKKRRLAKIPVQKAGKKKA